jgi:hypothetical protein
VGIGRIKAPTDPFAYRFFGPHGHDERSLFAADTHAE